MTKRDNELTRHELLDKRVKQLFEKFDMHRGQLPQDLLTAVEGVRKAHAMPYVRSGVRDAVVGVDMPHGALPELVPVVSEPVVVAPHAPAIALEGARKSEPVTAVAPDAPAKPGDLT
jgi:hypothetical protein